MLGKFACFLSSADFFKIDFFKKKFQEHYQSVKQFGPRSGPTFCRSRSGSKLFAKVISRQQNLPLAGKELRYISHIMYLNNFPAVGCKTPMMNNKKCFPMHSKICPTDPKEPGTITNVLTRNLWCSLLILHPTYCNFAKIIVLYFQLLYRNSDLLVIK